MSQGPFAMFLMHYSPHKQSLVHNVDPRGRSSNRFGRAGCQALFGRSVARRGERVARRTATTDLLPLLGQAAVLTLATMSSAAAVLLKQPWQRGSVPRMLARLLEPLTGDMQLSDLSVEPLRGPFAAEIHGLSLTSPILPRTAKKLRALLHEKGVLVFREQLGLEKEDLVQLAQVFGQPVIPRDLEEFVSSYDVTFTDSDEKHPSAADFWHSDNSYMDVPAGPTLLYALQVPRTGSRAFGDTLFSDTVLAASELTESLRAQVSGLNAVHRRLHNAGIPRTEVYEWELTPDVIHPVVRKHPITAQDALFVGPSYVSHLVGLEPKASADLLDELYTHMLQPCYIYRHQWSEGEVVVWDNARMLHKATNLETPPGLERRMWRVQTRGPGFC